jgi:hypothetical protein
MRRLVEADAAGVWLLPIVPEGAGPTVLDELGLAATAVEQPNDTARVLAACLRCCWSEPSGSPWPGVAASWEQVTAVFRMITDNRDERVSNIALVAGVRRLAGSSWLRWSEATRVVQLGPRVAAWSDPELSTLRELWRLIPNVEKPGDNAPGAVGTAETVVDIPVETVDTPGEPVDAPVDDGETSVGELR